MRNLLYVLLFIPLLAFSGMHPGIMDSAKKICSNESDCVAMIAIALDGSYHDGQVYHEKRVPMVIALKEQTDKLSDLCSNAPDKNLCNYYRHELMKEFYLGFIG